MIKGFALIPKKEEISRDQFHKHWEEVHAPLAQRIKVLRRYVQSHRIAEPVPGFDQFPYEGAAEIWFDDVDAIAHLGDNPDYINGALADEPNFIDQSKLRFLATREEVVIPGPKIERDTPLLKAIFLLKRRTDLGVAEFQMSCCTLWQCHRRSPVLTSSAIRLVANRLSPGWNPP